MITNDFHPLPWVRALAIPTVLMVTAAAAGCAARVLDVGSTGAPGSNGGGPGSTASASSGGAIAYAGDCTPASCGDMSASCASLGTSFAGATPTNLKCSPDPYAGQGSDPAGSCLLSFDCASVAGVGAAPDGGSCPAWTTPGYPTSCSQGVCGGTSGAAVGGQGGGFVTVEMDPSNSGSGGSAILSAYFNHLGGASQAPTQLGACLYDPQGASRGELATLPGAPAPNPGAVTAAAPGVAFSMTATPACDGTYAPVTGAKIIAAGDLVAFQWTPPSDDPDTFPSTFPAVPAPHPIALDPQAFAAASPSISRAADVPVSWNVMGTPLALEQVVVQLTQGVATVTCSFDASAGSGVVPADALLKLSAAPASYEVYSQHAAELNDVPLHWDVIFSVNAVAPHPDRARQGNGDARVASDGRVFDRPRIGGKPRP